MTRILVTGSRKWKDRAAIAAALLDAVNRHPWPIIIVTGGQVSEDRDTGEKWGADYIAGEVAREVGLEVEEHPAHKECSEHGWEHSFRKHGRPGGPIRNRVMVEKGAAECLAFPLGESRGTRGCMALADAAGIPVENYEPRFLWCRTCKRDYLVKDLDAHTHS
jgi:hypothetical protein